MSIMKDYLLGMYYTAATMEITCTPFDIRLADRKPAVMDMYRRAGADKAVEKWADDVMATRMPHTLDDLRRLSGEAHQLARIDKKFFARHHFALEA